MLLTIAPTKVGPARPRAHPRGRCSRVGRRSDRPGEPATGSGGGGRSKSSFHHDHMEHTGPGGSGGGGDKPYNDQYPLTRPEIVSHGVFR